MNENFLDIHNNEIIIKRTSEEINSRITQLLEKIEGYDVWIHKGYCQVPEPRAQHKKNLFEGKLLELRWLQGENIDINDGVY